MLTYRLLKLSQHASWLLVLMIVAGVMYFSPGVAVLVVGLLVAFKAKRQWGEGWAHGTARWANWLDLLNAGAVGRRGLYVGQLAPPTRKERRDILRYGSRCEDVARLFFARRDVSIRLSQGVHTLICAPAGTGKSVGVIIPFLLECPDAVVVLDLKGELHKATGEARRKMGQKVIALDPFGCTGAAPATFNPLDSVDPNHPEALDKLRAIAMAVIPNDPNEREKHWPDSARLWLVAFMAYVLVRCEKRHRNLQAVMVLMTDPTLRDGVVQEMMKMEEYDMMLQREAGQLLSHQSDELASILSCFNRHTNWLNSAMVRNSTTQSSFDVLGIRDKVSIFLTLDPSYIRSHSAMMRLWVESLLQAVIRGGAREDKKVWFVLDEAAALGRGFDAIEMAVCQLRGYGVRCILAYQSMGQLKTCFTEGQDITILANTDNRLYFGINDYATAEDISKQLGSATIVTTSQSGGSSRDKSYSPEGQVTVSHSSNEGWSAEEMGRELLQAAEILQLDPRYCIVLSKGIRPFTTYLTRYYEPGFRERLPGRFMMFCRAAVLAATMVSLVVGAGVVGWLVVVGR